MADVSSTLRLWSATPGSNNPAGTTAIGAGLDDNLREMQAVVRKYLASAASNMASAATVDLSTADGFWITITGTVTITSFGTEQAGIWYGLKFSDALTLTHNASSLILPGGANITTAAGDSCLAESLGSGNWRIHSYQAVSSSPIAKIATTTGDLLQASAANTLARLAIGAAGTRMHSTGTLAEWQGTWFKSGNLTRDLSLASGNVAYTGVGFKPKAIIFLSGFTTGAAVGSVGWSDGSTHGVLYNDHVDVSTNWVIATSLCIFAAAAGGANQSASVASFDSDGFTLAWTKTGSPTGTITVPYLALR